ncbi:hypothetical protein EBL_c01380 [Shimwellia blattae DSM 4481 = NBRC 105725]|uniref:Uncharacterized protein n=1 Tax=Shimwellia blattae (strain ATCC 29907 / DSM 4481 / JCM 1650 / NBRC 105725 / CDC 9005-74) TaxID=630626 RepID=I2B419_SHIBC|nr:hypothetical protein EBL_c01380 [Shimwellia blattae DSM 4481 = NBRC 105725]
MLFCSDVISVVLSARPFFIFYPVRAGAPAKGIENGESFQKGQYFPADTVRKLPFPCHNLSTLPPVVNTRRGDLHALCEAPHNEKKNREARFTAQKIMLPPPQQ